MSIVSGGKLAHALMLLAYFIVSASGLMYMKLAGATVSPRFLFGTTLYGLGFLIWYVLLLNLPLSVVFPLAAGGLIVATQLLGYMVLGEPLSILHLCGTGLVVLGISIIFCAGG